MKKLYAFLCFFFEAKRITHSEKRHKKLLQKTTFTRVIKGVFTNAKGEYVKEYLIRQPVTNASRITNDNGPLPSILHFNQDISLVSYLITHGVTICFMRYKVEKSQTNGRPFPSWRCLQYHSEKPCTNQNTSYKFRTPHPSQTCPVLLNTSYCATRKKQCLRTAASKCPLRPFERNPRAPEEIYGPATTTQDKNTTCADLNKPNQNSTDIEQINFQNTKNYKICEREI